MRLPSRLTALLSTEPSLHSAVLLAVNRAERWMDRSHLTFFPDWTDHGAKHVESVLISAASLISDEAWVALTPHDAAVLILAVVLHDSAMLLNDDGFHSLVNRPRSLIKRAGDVSWQELWKKFLLNQRKFAANELRDMFEDDDLTRLRTPDHWTAQHRRVIGQEFLRPHHSRLAHEIALTGLPTIKKRPFLLIKDINTELCDLSGFVARSHFMELRDCLRYLKCKYDIREYQGVHAVFLMALLRVADYLQLHSERAPGEFLRIQRLRSPKSEQEWKSHEEIRDIRQSHEDPRAIFIHATPTTVDRFLKIRSTLDGIQYELDSSAELLDELNGRYTGLKQLTLAIRRVRSNLDDLRSFERTVNYVPSDVKFRAEGGELLRKLVKPLYGNRPAIGVRELLQNAIDAVLELRFYRPAYVSPPIALPDGREVHADIVLTLNKTGEAPYFSIEDRGIGMSATTIRDYFLTAGKSLRVSREWKSRFMSDGAPVVPRSGRFGVGALAAFLLGAELQVATRFVDAKHGYRFTAPLNEDPIALRKHTGAEVGTTIRITLARNALEALEDYDSWDWFCRESPIVQRIVVDDSGTAILPKVEGRSLPLKEHQPLIEHYGRTTICWHPLKVHGFSQIHWGMRFDEWYGSGWRRVGFNTYVGQYRFSKERDDGLGRIPKLTCNGLVVMEQDRDSWLPNEGIDIPYLSVVEGSRELPLTLQRDDIEAALLFDNELANDAIRSIIACAILFAPTSRDASRDARTYDAPGVHQIVYCGRGMTFLDGGLLRRIGIDSLACFISNSSPDKLPLKWHSNAGACFGLPTSLDRLRIQRCGRLYSGRKRAAVVDSLQEVLGLRSAQDRDLKITSKRLKHGWQSIIGKCPPSNVNSSAVRLSGYDILECYLEKDMESDATRFENVMCQLIPDGLIPYDWNERRSKLKAAIEAVGPFLELYRTCARKLEWQGRTARQIMPE